MWLGFTCVSSFALPAQLRGNSSCAPGRSCWSHPHPLLLQALLLLLLLLARIWPSQLLTVAVKGWLSCASITYLFNFYSSWNAGSCDEAQRMPCTVGHGEAGCACIQRGSSAISSHLLVCSQSRELMVTDPVPRRVCAPELQAMGMCCAPSLCSATGSSVPRPGVMLSWQCLHQGLRMASAWMGGSL